MKNQKNKSAIVLIEFQKQWTEKGLYRCMINGQLIKKETIQNTKKLVSKARNLTVPIIHAPLVINPQRKKGIFAHITFGKIFTEGTWKAEFTDAVYQVDDPVVKGRYAFDAFIGSNLDQILKQNDIKNVFLCGFVTDQCVKKTLKTALKKGFNAFIVTDCTATFLEFLQKNTEKKYCHHTYTSEEFLLELSYPSRFNC